MMNLAVALKCVDFERGQGTIAVILYVQNTLNQPNIHRSNIHFENEINLLFLCLSPISISITSGKLFNHCYVDVGNIITIITAGIYTKTDSIPNIPLKYPLKTAQQSNLTKNLANCVEFKDQKQTIQLPTL